MHVQALEKRSSELVNMLQQTYNSSLVREPAFLGLLDRIKASYLGAPSASGMQGLMSSMLQQMMSNG